jgi:hypothetical protein
MRPFEAVFSLLLVSIRDKGGMRCLELPVSVVLPPPRGVYQSDLSGYNRNHVPFYCLTVSVTGLTDF